MGKKKQPFIDRKHASTYQLMHRSQRDVSQDHLPSSSSSQQQQHQVEGGEHTINPNNNGMILWPSPANQASTNDQVLGRRTVLEEWRATLDQAGLLDNSNNNNNPGDPSRYLKEISGGGTFVTPQGRVVALAAADGRSKTSPVAHQPHEDWDMLEVKGAPQVDNIALSEALDEDMRAMLYGDIDVDAGNFEELHDEFILDAAQEPTDDDQAAALFDYDAHIRELLEKAKEEREGIDGSLLRQQANRWARQDHDFFATLQPLRERAEGDDHEDEHEHEHQREYHEEHDEPEHEVMHTPGVVSALSPDEERALCEKFEQTLLEYDSDEIGDNPYEEIGGDRPLEGDVQLEAALDDFLAEREDDILIHGNPEVMAERRRGGGSGYSVLVGKQMIPAKDLEENPALVDADLLGDLPPAQVVLAEAQARLAEPYVRPPAEDVLIDGQSYFSERVRNPWDCESILSTYSNLDNNPVTIGTGGRRRRKASKKKPSMADPVQQIQLSAKTGLPLGVFSSKSKDDDDVEDEEEGSQFYDGSTMMSVNRGVARYKNETAEEKRARKAALKQERQMARIQKKVTREVFQEEFAKRSVSVHADDVAGKTVFRYS